MANNLNKIINEQILAWERENSGKNRVVSTSGDSLPVITISREFGALGATLAGFMGEKIGFKVWDQNILGEMAEQLGSNEKTIEELDENHRELIEDMVAGFMKNLNTNVSYLRSLNKVVKTIETRGNAIIVGRGANYICKQPGSLHVRVVSPLEQRIVDYAKRKGIDRDESQSIIERTDAERAAFVQYYFKKDVTKSSDYDLILNSATYSLEEMMTIILKAYEQKNSHKLEVLN